MLSVLIPVYNYNVNQLIKDLYRQLKELEKTFEILIFDDGSDESYKKENRPLADFPHVIYKEMESNLGRSKIRNRLAREAKFKYLLFMDCDASVCSSSFIEKYFKLCNDDLVICGGTTYQNTPPDDPAKRLRWKYGYNRERIPAKERQKKPWHSFSSFNFVVSKKIFQKIGFNENIMQYGHEDTLFGFDLKERKIHIHHIENPLLHDGIEESEVFLEKTRSGIRNLCLLLTQQKENPDFARDIKLLKVFRSAKRYCLTGLISILFKISSKYLLKNLTSENPRLLLFDFYKLGYLITTFRSVK